MMDDLTPDLSSSEKPAQAQGMELARANLRALLKEKNAQSALLATAESEAIEDDESLTSEPEADSPVIVEEEIMSSDEADDLPIPAPLIEVVPEESASANEPESPSEVVAEVAAPLDAPESPIEVEASSDEPSDEAEATPIVYRYRLAAPLLLELETQINAARQHIGLDPLPIGSATWLPDFHSEQIEDIITALQTWAKNHLPLKLAVERVQASVEGTQRYIAAYTLAPAARLVAAQVLLEKALAPLIEPLPQEADLPFSAQVLVADQIPAGHFPKLIQFMQTHFNPFAWQLESLELLQTPDDDLRWEVREVIRK